MSFREIPPSISHVLAAARRIDPLHGVFVSIAPKGEGPAWELHPFRRWLILRDLDRETLIAAVACSLLLRGAYLGAAAITAIPEHLRVRHQQAREALIAALDDELGAGGDRDRCNPLR